MNKHITVFILSIGSLLAQAAAADPMSGDLTIAVGGFSSDRGQMIANLFREGASSNVPIQACRQPLGLAGAGRSRWRVRAFNQKKCQYSSDRTSTENKKLPYGIREF
jgi:hypothetical protein